MDRWRFGSAAMVVVTAAASCPLPMRGRPMADRRQMRPQAPHRAAQVLPAAAASHPPAAGAAVGKLDGVCQVRGGGGTSGTVLTGPRGAADQLCIDVDAGDVVYNAADLEVAVLEHVAQQRGLACGRQRRGGIGGEGRAVRRQAGRWDKAAQGTAAQHCWQLAHCATPAPRKPLSMVTGTGFMPPLQGGG